MKVPGVPGVFYSQAFLTDLGTRKLCGCFHSGMNEVLAIHQSISKVHIEWPVEIYDGIAYVPAEEELKDGF